ncbi:MAG: c-type cytochrome [Candidatus Marinimicrobia bacterium]|nr:c-type cytochrome [Candidatus Neomarinimicrobiota bacterium]
MSLKQPKDLSIIFAFTSIVFLIVSAISPAKDYFSEWRHFQNKFNKLVKEQPRRIKPVDIGIKQMWIQDLDRVDRCTSCHLGVTNYQLVDMPEPFQPHPKMFHDPEEFGCTVCHHGQGIATTVDESVGEVEFWDDPMLPQYFIEASCGVCHKDRDVQDAPILTEGRQLIQQYNCVSCHNLPGYTPEFVPGLDGIGKKTTREWLVRWLKDPREVQPDTKMPDFNLTEKEVQILADFLMTFNRYPEEIQFEPLPDALKEEWPDEDLVDLGKTRVREARCISCHLINGKGGHLATEIGQIASAVTPIWIYNYIRNPKGLHPGVPMPEYGFTKEEAIAVSAYILTEFRDWDLEEDTTSISHTPAPDFYRQGLKLFNNYNCLGCHELSAEGVGRNMGPDLTYIGSKPQTELEFGEADIEETRPSYVYHKIKDPRQFLPNSRMPDFGFSDSQIRAVTTALLSQRKEEIPDKYIVHKTNNQEQYKPQGEFGRIVRKYACFTCHVILDSGYLLATDLSLEGSRVNHQWLRDYFKIPYTLRPILTERMPNLFMKESEMKFTADYINVVFLDDDIDSVNIQLDDPETIQQGKKLLHEIYGCHACHQVNGKGGYVGPPLNETAKRSKPGWIYSWIKNPQKYRPDTIDPNQGLTDTEAKQITAYIMSLEKSE